MRRGVKMIFFYAVFNALVGALIVLIWAYERKK